MKALFIDRDGVINRMVKYGDNWDAPQKLQDVRLTKKIEKIISWANKNGILVVEVSNQPSVAKGKMDQKNSNEIEKKVQQLLADKGVFIDKAYICSHHPDAVVPELKKICDCRKPKPGLILRAARELGIKLEQSIFLGDKASDAAAAKNAGVKSLIYLHGEDEPNKTKRAKRATADFKTSSIRAVAQLVDSFFRSK